MWSNEIGVIAHTAGRLTRLVASSRPPSPTSSTTRSAGWRAKARNAAAVVTSKKVIGRPALTDSTSSRIGTSAASSISSSRHADALVEAHQMRRGVDVHAQAGRFGNGAHGGNGRAFAVGAGDVHDGREAVLRIAQLRHQPADAVEREVDRLRMQLGQAVEDRIGAQLFVAPGASLSGMPSARLRQRQHFGRRPRRHQQLEDADQQVAQLVAMGDDVDHAVLAQIFRALEAGRQLLADRLLDDARAGKADHRPRLGDGDVAQHREGGGHAAGGGIGQHHDERQARFLDLIRRDHGARQLHQRQDALLHARPAGRRHDDQCRLLQHREFRSREQRLAHGDAHRAAHEIEIEDGSDHRQAGDAAMRNHDRVLLAGLFALLLQAVAVALLVSKAQRVGRRLRQFDAHERSFVEQHRQAAQRRQPHVVAAMRAHPRVRLEVAVENHLGAGRALVPEVLGHLRLAHEGADLRPDEIGQPVHGALSVRLARRRQAARRAPRCRAPARSRARRPGPPSRSPEPAPSRPRPHRRRARSRRPAPAS